MDAGRMAPGRVTQLLLQLSGGNHEVAGELVPLIYAELKRIAGGQLRKERPGHTLQATALVHEAYLKLVDQRGVTWQSRAHFFGVAATVMRRILLDYAKSRNRFKRGGGVQRISFDEDLVATAERASELIQIDEALTRLERLDPRQAKVVEMRFFGGLSVEETSVALGVSEPTVKREWAMAKAWLHREIGAV